MEISPNIRRWFGIPLVCGVLGISACSAARPPVATVAQADLAVRQATESTAAQHAPAELNVAREKLMGAQRAMTAEEYDRARRLAEQAIVDAQLAQAKGNADEAQQNTNEVRQTIDALRTEANRPTVP